MTKQGVAGSEITPLGSVKRYWKLGRIGSSGAGLVALALGLFAAPGVVSAETVGQASETEKQAFLIQVEDGTPEHRAERFQRLVVISMPFSAVHSYALCYLAAGLEQKDKTPSLSEPRDYKPYMLGGAVGLSLAIAIYDALHWNRRNGQLAMREPASLTSYRQLGSQENGLALLRLEVTTISF